MQQGIALMRANMQYITDSSSTKRAFCRTESDVFSGGFEGVSVSEEMAESSGNPGDPSAPGKEAPPGSIRAPPGDPTLKPRASGKGEILAKSRR
jgi:hypothetical protein